MSKIKFIYIDEEEETKEIKQLLDKGLIKYFYGKDSTEPDFIYLTENEDIIKSSITSKYHISNLIEQMMNMFNELNITAKNLWGNEFSLSYKSIINLIKDDLYGYISESTQKLIFNAEMPADKLTNIVKEISKEQLKRQIEDLLIEAKNAI